MTATELTAFWEDVGRIAAAVSAYLCNMRDGQFVEKTMRDRIDCDLCQGQTKQEVVSRLILIATRFKQLFINLPMKDAERKKRNEEWQIPFIEAMSGSEWSQHLLARGEKATKEHGLEIAMEHLTAAWLALYFLGIPFGQPWSEVRRMADDISGFPSGACVMKALGDIYREMRVRHQIALMRGDPLPSKSEPDDHERDRTLIVSAVPSALLREALEYVQLKFTPAPAHLLARCYANLQLRLHVRAGLKVHYMVQLETLKRFWNWEGPNPVPLEDGEAVREILGWMEQGFGAEAVRNCDRLTVTVLLGKEGFRDARIPPCVLGDKRGLYQLDPADTLAPFAGNFIRTSALDFYRLALLGLERRFTESGIAPMPIHVVRLCGDPEDVRQKWVQALRP